MKKLKSSVMLFLILSISAHAEMPFKIFAEPYIEKSVSAKSQKIGNVASQYGDASVFSIGSKLGLESSIGLLGGLGFDHTSATVINNIPTNSGYDISFQSFNAFLGFKILDIFRVTYSRSFGGNVSTSDGANREIDFASNKISLGVLISNKAYVEISRSEKSSNTKYFNASLATRAEIYDTYSIGLSYPIELM